MADEHNTEPNPESPAEQPKEKRSKITCLVVFLLFLVGGGFFLVRAVRDAREAARSSACRCHLKQIGLALHNYHQTYDCFPPQYVTDAKGRPMHSWRVLLLPYIESSAAYDRYRLDDPWDSPNNLAVAKEMAFVFKCPSQPKVDYPITNFVAIAGPHAFFDGTRCRKLEDITDGTSYTIMFVGAADSGICWNEPRDLNFDEIDFRVNGPKRPGIGSHHPGIVHVAICDGSVDFLRNTTPPEVVKALATIDGGEDVELPERE